MNVKKITLNAILLTVMGLFSSNVNAQVQKSASTDKNDTHNEAHNSFIRCATVEYEAELKAKFAERQTQDQFEQWLAPLVAQLKADKAANRNVAAVYNIPVVIHIIHDGDCIGTGENITDAQAISQINVLNQDYRRLVGTPGGVNSTGLATDIEINFVLAKRDPNGNPSNGIDRVQTTTAGYNRAAVESAKATTIWDPTKYLNMWTFRFSGDLATVLGYAQFPSGSTLTGVPTGTTTANTDGVVASYDAFGTIAENDGTFILNNTYNLGRTMTHEVGHWLGLRHIWGDTAACPAGNTALDKDFCADTPAAAAENYTCNLTADSCPSNPGLDMVQNYMDYTNDACMDTFTPDQKNRMQTVMANALRRSTLNASNGGTAPSAGIYFNEGFGKCIVTEGTNCSYTDVNYKLSVIKAPTANAVVTFAVNPTSTATNNVDFQIMTPTVTFASGSTADQNLTVRFFNDGIAETTELANITMTVNANGGDGSVITSRSELKVSIVDNDVAPIASYNSVYFNETFDPTPSLLTSIKDLDGDGNNWGFGSSANTVGFSTNFGFSRSWLSATNTPLTPDNIIFTPTAITIPAGTSTLSFGIGTTQTGAFYLERYSVYLTTVNPSTFTSATLNAQTAVINNAVLAGAAQRNTITANVSSYAGQTVYLVFRHHNTNDQNWIMLDDITLTNAGTTLVQTAVNTATKYQALISAAGTFYAKDASSGNVILDGTANAFNYGCTSVEVSRSTASAGAPAVDYAPNTAANLKVMAKTFLVTPTTNSPAGSVNLKFYFTEAEIAAWETATGNSRTALKVFKSGQAGFYPTTIGAFGTGNVTISATSPTGLAGTYYFGIDSIVLGTTQVDALSGISIYPNPASTELNINMVDGISENTKYTIFNNLGQTLKSVKVNSNSDLKINTASYSQGVYIIKIEKDGNAKTLKFIKE